MEGLVLGLNIHCGIILGGIGLMLGLGLVGGLVLKLNSNGVHGRIEDRHALLNNSTYYRPMTGRPRSALGNWHGFPYGPCKGNLPFCEFALLYLCAFAPLGNILGPPQMLRLAAWCAAREVRRRSLG